MKSNKQRPDPLLLAQSKEAIRRLDAHTLAGLPLSSLPDDIMDDLVKLADRIVVREISKTARKAAKISSDRIATAAHSHAKKMLDYVATRATLLGSCPYQDDLPDLGVY